MDTFAATPLRSRRAANLQSATARRGSAATLGAPYRSESFAEDLFAEDLLAAPSTLATPWALRRGRVLLAVPLGLALIGSVAPILGGVA
jgi:hypothetical protein